MNFEALRASTLPGLLVERARSRPERVAFRAKELGIWRETTWRELAARVAALACGFAREYRINTGETVAIIGNPCPEWTIADLAAQALGGITYGIYPTSAPGEVRHLLQHGGASLIVVEDQEHLDKALAVLDQCPDVRAVLVIDTRALFMYRRPRRARSLRAGTVARRAGDDHLHVRHDRTSERRGVPPRAASGGLRQHHRALSDLEIARAPGRRDAAVVPRDGPQSRDHDAAHRRHRAALPGVGGHLRRCPLRDPADVRLHRTALSPEVRGPLAGRARPELMDQAGRLPGGDARRPASARSALEPGRQRRTVRGGARPRDGLPLAPREGRLRARGAGGLE